MTLETSEKMTSRKLLSYLKVRKKFSSDEDSGMKRVLSVLDLTLLGIGSMLGMGVYIMSGTLAVTVGPAMVISFILAGFVSILSAFCYAEFAGRAPGTGSAYAYCYITVGEFIAFLLGWNLVLEFVIGTACLARSLSGYVDSLANHSISKTISSVIVFNGDFFSSYPDFFSLLIMIVFSGLISFGVRESTIVNNIVVAVNMTTICALVVIGIVHADTSNWSLSPPAAHLPPNSWDPGKGGFFPYGLASVLQGTATCFYAYTGFDTVATTGGEAKNPKRAIPLALISSLLTAIVVYACISSTFTLMWPYYDQRTDAPYAHILSNIGLSNLKWIVTVGATAAITGSTLASCFGMARIVYSIAADGLLFKFLGRVNDKTKTPVAATLVSGIITGLLSVIFNTEQLVLMTSLGTLMAYTMVAICVLLLRYEPVNRESNVVMKTSFSVASILNTSSQVTVKENTFIIAIWSIIIYTVGVTGLNLILTIFMDDLLDKNIPAIVFACFYLVIVLGSSLVLQRQPRESANLTIQVKPVPLLPLITIFVNMNLMLSLPYTTWIRFFAWLIIGLVIYFSYGLWNSKERPRKTEPNVNTISIVYN